jgi:hypothetical protein
MSEIRLAIVIVKRSLEAANAIIAGNNVNLIASLSMTPSDFACFPDHAMEVESALPAVRQNEKGSDLSPKPFLAIALKEAEII